MKRTNLKLFGGLLSVMLATLVAYAQSVNYTSRALTANTALNVLAGRYVVDTVRFYNPSSSNVATIKFYDSSTTSTNTIRPAYTSINTYETNYSTVTTNASGLLQTNTFTGYYSAEVSNGAVTNERARLAVVSIAPGATRDIPIQFITAAGLTVLSDAAGYLDVSYKGN